jgi:hypothetical protein
MLLDLPLVLLDGATLLISRWGEPRAQAHAARRSARLPTPGCTRECLSTALSMAVPTAYVWQS